MKHPYRPECQCDRCQAEKARRTSQARANHVRHSWPAIRYRGRRTTRPSTRRPTPGSQEWAETRGDDLDESPDY